MELTRITRKLVEVDVAATLADGTTATITGVTAALLTPNRGPAADTVWTTADYAGGTATVLLAGPDADPAQAMVVPAEGADLWIRVADAPEVDAARVVRVAVI